MSSQSIMNLRNTTLWDTSLGASSTATSRSKFGEILNVNNHNIFSKAVGSERASLLARTPEEYSIPKPVYIKLSTLVAQLSVALEKETHETYDVCLDDIIVECKKIVREKYTYNNVKYAYKYYWDHVCVGILTERYNWFIQEAEKLTSLKICQKGLTLTNGYTWVIAQTYSTVECRIYSNQTKTLVSIGSLKETILSLNSNVVGMGNFRISVMKSDIDGKYFLKFKLNRFQLTNKIDKSSIIKEAVNKTEPPEDLIAKLHIKN